MKYLLNHLRSRRKFCPTFFNETSQSSERYSAQMQAVTTSEILILFNLSNNRRFTVTYLKKTLPIRSY